MSVIVVGAGPTGLMLATELALAGVDVEVVEREAAPSGQARGGGVNPRTAEVLAMRGLLDAVTKRGAIPLQGGAHFAGLPVPLDARPWRTRYPAGVAVWQDRLEEVLEERLGELGGTVRRGTELTGLHADPDGVTATVSGPTEVERLRAEYLVGCDGGHSTARGLAGVGFPGRAGTMAAVSADVELADRSETVPRGRDHISVLTRKGGGYWMLLHPVDGTGQRYRAVFGGSEQKTLSRQAPVTPDEVGRALTAVHGPGTRLGRLRWGTRFSDAARQVTDYRVGRVLFAGDAAHIHAPVGGQGLNLGVQDAANLGWKLAAQVRGDAPDGLLDSYHAERHPVAARVIATVRAQGVLMSPPPDADDVWALREIVIDLARLPDANRHLAGLMSGLDLRYDLGGTDPLVGARMPDLDLIRADGQKTRVSTLLHAGRGLLLELGNTREPAPPGVDVVGSQPVGSADGIGCDTGANPGVDRILVRPDGYVCWVGTGPGASPDAALRRWFGSPPLNPVDPPAGARAPS